MPMGESYLFIADALLHRSRFRRLRLRGLSYEKKGGKGETEAKNPNSNHDSLFSRPSDLCFSGPPCCPIRREGYQCVGVFQDEARIYGVKPIVVKRPSMIGLASPLSCPNTNHRKQYYGVATLMLRSSPSETSGCQREALNANPELRVIGSNSINLLMLLA